MCVCVTTHNFLEDIYMCILLLFHYLEFIKFKSYCYGRNSNNKPKATAVMVDRQQGLCYEQRYRQPDCFHTHDGSQLCKVKMSILINNALMY